MAASEHPAFLQPTNPDIRVWRYMDLGKFVWLLQQRALFFARVDHLGDPYEGYFTKAQVSSEEAYVHAAKIRGDSVEEARRMFKSLLDMHRFMRTSYFVSSWHMNEVESAAMWRVYTSFQESICITTTYSKLYEALPPLARMGIVQYINYESEAFEMDYGFNFVMHKRTSYLHEREARAVVWSHETGVEGAFATKDNGIVVPIDLNRVITEVYLSPAATPMLLEVVTGLVQKYDIIVAVRQSEVNSPPAF